MSTGYRYTPSRTASEVSRIALEVAMEMEAIAIADRHGRFEVVRARCLDANNADPLGQLEAFGFRARVKNGGLLVDVVEGHTGRWMDNPCGVLRAFKGLVRDFDYQLEAIERRST